MIKINNIGVSVEKGSIPPTFRLPFKLFDATIAIDMGSIPPKNYFPTRLFGIGVSVDKADESMMWYNIE